MTLESAQETAERLAKEAEGGLRVGSHGHVKPASASAFLALAERCEKEAPGRRLDAAISTAVIGVRTGTFEEFRYPHYTTSLDAALSLITEAYAGYSRWYVEAVENRAFACAGAGVYGAQTPALALCAAALRARAAMAEDAGGPTGKPGQGDMK